MIDENVDIAQLIRKGGVLKNIEGKTPEEIYAKVCKMIDLPEEMTSDQVYSALCAREEVLSTAVGNGIALPHSRSPIIKEKKDQRICVVYLKTPIDMHAPDERSVYVMFILLTQNSQFHLKVLSSLAALFRNCKFRKTLEAQADEAEIEEQIKELA